MLEEERARSKALGPLPRSQGERLKDWLRFPPLWFQIAVAPLGLLFLYCWVKLVIFTFLNLDLDRY